MTRPNSVTAASWIWLFCGLFTTITIANVVAATNVLAFIVAFGGTEDDLMAVEVIGWMGTLMAVCLVVSMLVQVVAAVKLRDGARWARVLLTISAVIALLTTLYDITLWSAWVLLAANIAALVLAYGETATDYFDGLRTDTARSEVDA